MLEMPEREQILRGAENEKLTNISIIKEVVEQEIDRLKKICHHDQTKYISQGTKRM